MVYFKNIRGATTKGSVTAGDVLVDPRSNIKTPSGYSSNYVSGETGDITAAATVTYNFVLNQLPVRTESVKLTVQDDANTYCIDDGKSNLLGKGISGTREGVSGRQ